MLLIVLFFTIIYNGYEEAKRHYIKALELDPNHFWAILNLGAI
jgi:Flp pilus assembly protein TadD